MPTAVKTDPATGVAVVRPSVYYSLGSPHWKNMTRGPFAPYTYHYSKPGEGWKDGEMATMNMANWGGAGKWYSALMRLDVALGFGQYEQSVKVGVGKGVTTTFYLSEYNQADDKPKDKNQEIDFEFAGQTIVQTNVWKPGGKEEQFSFKYDKLEDSTGGWGFNVYRYRIDWEPATITWSVDVSGSGNSFVPIHSQDMASVGRYEESLCYVYISFWQGWTPDGSKFDGEDAKANCGESGACHQAFYFQPLKFTPSNSNTLVILAS